MSQIKSITQVREQGYIVGSINDEGIFSFSSRPVFHPAVNTALDEADRLSRQTPGKAYVVFRAVGGAFMPRQVSPTRF